MKQYCSLVLIIFLAGCACEKNSTEPDRWKEEIVQSEHDFAALAAKEGIAAAFLFYADDSAVLNRNNALIVGKAQISDYFAARGPSAGTLAWSPEFVEVAASGDLGYTYGHYTYSFSDSLGVNREANGVFHTVWKKQADGQWRFVWD